MPIILDNIRFPYDTLNPDKNLTEFLSFLREVKARYEGNEREQEDRESRLQDLEHYAELHSDMDCAEGYRVYKQIRDVRRERRGLKNENELLTPLYEWMGENEATLNKLSAVLGRVRKTKEVIDKRMYTPRTDVLEEKEGAIEPCTP